MAFRKPALLVASSQESIEIARAVAAHLENDAEVIVWDEEVAEFGKTLLESLAKRIEEFDFAVLVLSADDQVATRGDEWLSPRDNVLFEVGLCMGALGRDRTFLLIQDDSALKLPSDWHGVTFGRFDPIRADENMRAAVRTPCSRFRQLIHMHGRRLGRLAGAQNLSIDVTLLKGPGQIFRSIVDAMKSVESDSLVVYRALPMEYTAPDFGRERELGDEYESIIRDLVCKGAHEVGYWDKTIYGQPPSREARDRTISFIRQAFIPCPDTSFIGVDESHSHVGLVLVGESATGYPSDFAWQVGFLLFSDPKAHRPLPLYGFMTTSTKFIAEVLCKWWESVESKCERKGQYWDSRQYREDPDAWTRIVDRLCSLISGERAN